MRPTSAQRLFRYGFAILCAAAGILARASLDSLWGLQYPYLVFHLTVLLAAWVAGSA